VAKAAVPYQPDDPRRRQAGRRLHAWQTTTCRSATSIERGGVRAKRSRSPSGPAVDQTLPGAIRPLHDRDFDAHADVRGGIVKLCQKGGVAARCSDLRSARHRRTTRPACLAGEAAGRRGARSASGCISGSRHPPTPTSSLPQRHAVLLRLAGPPRRAVVLSMPKIDPKRFYTSQWNHSWGYVLDNLGSVLDGSDGHSYLIASPSWQDTMPPGITRCGAGRERPARHTHPHPGDRR
jgi:hypothetical protein